MAKESLELVNVVRALSTATRVLAIYWVDP
jgi:hypothetical protein